MHSPYKVKDIREYFVAALLNKAFTTDKTGQKTIELIGANFIADETAIFGSVNHDYVMAELDWYKSKSTNINDIYEDRDPPAAWQYAADKYGNINSNYGALIWSPKFYSQYYQALTELTTNKDTRRAIMIYNRPSMWEEYNEGGKSDFICTNAVTYYIRDGKIHAVVQMRSNDVVYGYKNDFAWQYHVMEQLRRDYNRHRMAQGVPEEQVETGNIYWQVQNLHVYERHFDLVK